ncbi:MULTISPECIES: flagellar biosynthesis repressor FlbT [Henriciella]|jgi:flagellar protein FlbT|uniref:Flagellum biosynthesis repressor protein FlbT n=1 Tax=Henriciella pelagia TaxID=1977912 RepID=A0ABQ1JCJ6_9PROT|nr:flagellar biosynthesis repressor FlbT [Henriciella pelagia]GGB62883.1 putative flagellum biosynthesis repressor protein FlbT [Henriciella pelagia]
MPLKLSLKPTEAVVVNGAVIRNGERRSTLLLETKARILRERDVMFPEEVNTNFEAAYFAVMQMYLTGETDGPLYDACIVALANIVRDAPSDELCDEIMMISRFVASGQLYRAIGACRKLERELPTPDLRDE